jgi:hypothetical protein
MENFRSECEADHIIELVAQKEECMVAATHALVLKKTNCKNIIELVAETEECMAATTHALVL